MKCLIILQARVNSKRLYGKVLKKIKDIPLVILCAKRLKNTGKPLIVAIPKDKPNLSLKRLIEKNKINYSLGPNKNVFSRFKKIISKYNAETIIIRATADNPLPNGKFVDEMIEIFQKYKLDYLDTTKKNFNLPYGLALQIFKAKLFNEVSKSKLNDYEKEHVCPKFNKLQNIKKYNKIFNKYLNIKKKINKKLSIDNTEDLSRLQDIFSSSKKPIYDCWTKLLINYYGK